MSIFPLPIFERDADPAHRDAMSDADIRLAWQRGHPIVLLHRTPPDGLPIPSVTVENKDGARRLVDHLLEVHGCRSVGYLRGPAGHEDSAWRELGFALTEDPHWHRRPAPVTTLEVASDGTGAMPPRSPGRRSGVPNTP